MKLQINTPNNNICRKFQLTSIMVLASVTLYLAIHNKLAIFVVTKYVAAFRPDQCESSWESVRQPTHTIFVYF